MSAPHEHEDCRVCERIQCIINGEMVEHYRGQVTATHDWASWPTLPYPLCPGSDDEYPV